MATYEVKLVGSLSQGAKDSRVAAKAQEGLKLWREPTHIGQSGLALLPMETLCEVLTFLDLRSLLMLKQTCAWLCGLVYNAPKEVLLAKVTQHLRDSSTGGSDGRRHSQAERSGLSGLEASLSRAFTDSMHHHATPLPDAQLVAFQNLLHPNDRTRDMGEGYGEQAFASIRVFPVPRSLCLVGDELSTAIARGIANIAVGIPLPAGSHWLDMEGDAWANGKPLTLGSELNPIASVAQLEALLPEAIDTFGSYAKGEDVVTALGKMVSSHEIMIWRDTQFKAKGRGGNKLFVLGAGRAAVVQWEFASNFCGGPYANYDCGMG